MRIYILIGCVSPATLISIWYENTFHKNIDLDNPKTLDEKINWMKLNCDTDIWTRCADKYSVRDYVQLHGLGETLNEIYGVYDTPDEIDFSTLPDKFVVKTTNGGGGKNVMIVTDRSSFNREDAVSVFRKWMRNKPWRFYVEPHYKDIKPRLLVEKYLCPNPGETALVDIKIHCINGKAYSVFLCSDRVCGEKVAYSSYDLQWQKHPEHILSEYSTEKFYTRPVSFDKMVEYSEILAKGIPYVRVDWYEIDGKPIFSEMTFTPGGGFQGFYTLEYLEEMGKLLDIKDV